MYKPTSVTETGQARVDKPNGGRRRVRERGEVLISRLKAYPVGTGGGGGGKGSVCEMCGEEFKRGDWVRKLPACRHEVSLPLSIYLWVTYNAVPSSPILLALFRSRLSFSPYSSSRCLYSDHSSTESVSMDG